MKKSARVTGLEVKGKKDSVESEVGHRRESGHPGSRVKEGSNDATASEPGIRAEMKTSGCVQPQDCGGGSDHTEVSFAGAA